KRSVVGAKAVQEHFPAGYAGPLTILIKNDEVDFSTGEGSATLEALILRIEEQAKELGIADIRYLHKPLGMNVGKLTWPERIVQKQRAPAYYISSVDGLAKHVTRVDVVFEKDPFDRESIDQLNKVEKALREALRDLLAEDTDKEGQPHLALLSKSEFQFV